MEERTRYSSEERNLPHRVRPADRDRPDTRARPTKGSLIAQITVGVVTWIILFVASIPILLLIWTAVRERNASTDHSTFGDPISRNDPRIKELLAAMNRADRATKGFLPVPPTALLYLTARDHRRPGDPPSGYDYQLTAIGAVDHTIFFQKAANGYRWVGEKETIMGTGEAYENATIEYQTVPLDDLPLNRTVVSYAGNSSELCHGSHGDPCRRNDLTLSQIAPYLRQWYRPLPEEALHPR